MWKIEKVVSKGDYNYAIVKEHPKATKNGYVLEHRIVMENHLGRLLNPNEVVHHKNGNKKDNKVENLEVCEAKEHAKRHGLKQGRQWVSLKCPWCKKIFIRPRNKTFLVKPDKYTSCSPSCRGRLSRYIQLHGITAEVEQAISENLVAEFTKIADDNSEETD